MPTPFRLVFDFVTTASFVDSSLPSSPLDWFLRRLINDEGAMSQTQVSDLDGCMLATCAQDSRPTPPLFAHGSGPDIY